MSVPQTPRRVLVVDDDSIARFICQSHLAKAGYEVVCAGNVPDARTQLAVIGAANFVAVISDYRMPQEDGLVLLDHIRQLDSTLSVIMVTAEGEKALVASSLRSGAVDFLDKPMSGAELLDAVARAAAETGRQRHLNIAEQEVRQIAHSQRSLLGQSTALLGKRFRYVFNPHAEAGGDFVAAFPIGKQRFLVLVSDVSGHDLQAAYRSAYLQGFARAMLASGRGSVETFQQINQLLLQEWNVGENDLLSLAACIADVDVSEQSLTLLNCGLPAPYFIHEDGFAELLVDSTASPLGWFEDLPNPVRRPLSGGSLLFWSDGLEELAERLGVSTLSLAGRLQNKTCVNEALLEGAIDDIIVVQLDLSAAEVVSGQSCIPILTASYSGSECSRIDEIQAFCERSLTMALPEIGSTVLHDVLMSIRESLLNALQHGCLGQATKDAHLSITYNYVDKEIVMRVKDPGGGHDFDFLNHEDAAATQLIDEHRGLLMIKHMAKRLDISAKGNCLLASFDCHHPSSQ